MAVQTKEILWVQSDETLGSALDTDLTAGWVIFHTSNESNSYEVRYRFFLSLTT